MLSLQKLLKMPKIQDSTLLMQKYQQSFLQSEVYEISPWHSNREMIIKNNTYFISLQAML